MTEVLTAVIVAFFGYILYGAAGFGAAMLFHSLWNLLELFGLTDGSVKLATYYLNIMTLVVTMVMSIRMRKLIQWNFVIVCVIPWTVMNIIGTELLTSVDNAILKQILGVFMYIIMVQQTVKAFYSMCTGKMLEERANMAKEKAKTEEEIPLESADTNESQAKDTDNSCCGRIKSCLRNLCKAEDFPDDIPLVSFKKQWPWILFAGCFGGILSGLYNMPGPSTIVILLFSGIHRERWKANFFLWQIPAQFYVCGYLSFHPKAQLFEPSFWYAYILMMLISIFGSRIGHWLGHKLNKVTFTFIVISISLMGGSSLLFSEMEAKSIIMSVAFLCALILLVALSITFYCTVLKKEKQGVNPSGTEV